MNKKYLMLIGLTAFCFTQSVAPLCASENDFDFTKNIPDGIKSKSGSDATKVIQKIRNGTSRYLDFRWINYEGNIELVRAKTDWGFVSLAPNNFQEGITFVGHPFIIMDSINGKLLGCYVFNKVGQYNLVLKETKDGFQIVPENIK